MNLPVSQPFVTSASPVNFYPTRQFVISNTNSNTNLHTNSNTSNNNVVNNGPENDNSNTNDRNETMNENSKSGQNIKSRWSKDHRIQLKQLMSSLPASDIGAALRVILDTYGVEASKLVRRGMTVELDLTDITDDFILDNLWNYCASVQYNQQLLAAQQQIHNAELQQQLTLQQQTIEQQQLQAQLAAAHHYGTTCSNVQLPPNFGNINSNNNTAININNSDNTNDNNNNDNIANINNLFPNNQPFDTNGNNSTHATQEFTMLKLEPLSQQM